MLEEVPLCKKCCVCIPLRYGLLTWVYIKLIITIFIFLTLVLSLYEMNGFCYGCTLFLIFFVIILIFVLTDIILDIVFIVGGHLKNVRLLTLFYRYSFVLAVVTIMLGVLSLLVFLLPVKVPGLLFSINLAIYSIALCIQIYFILLLRSEIIKLRSNCSYRYVKNAPGSEGSVHKEEIDGLKENEHVYENEMS
ncbi:uncharacterized protein LOC113503804 [Trichoplusia ni]|uniref:Uncharacterized protein LOC113503804 n=1 Tax=Trichoplusia ni TaxID=7111 RepID=A0A7E5WLS7_TRINI|nr:uncharacterized protein LOC113503804 [Trichoplusia ni]